MSQYVGTAMLVSSTATPEIGKIGDLMIIMPGDGYEVHFVFLYEDDEPAGPVVVRDHGRAIRRGNTLSFVQNGTHVEYVFEMIEWEMF